MGIREGTEITEKGDLIVGKIIMGQGPIGLVPIDVEIVHIHRNPIDTKTVRIRGSPINVRTIHENMWIGVQIPQRSDGPVTPPWML